MKNFTEKEIAAWKNENLKRFENENPGYLEKIRLWEEEFGDHGEKYLSNFEE